MVAEDARGSSENVMFSLLFLVHAGQIKKALRMVHKAFLIIRIKRIFLLLFFCISLIWCAFQVFRYLGQSDKVHRRLQDP